MPIWLVPIITWFSHNLARFLGVVIIALLIIGVPMVVYHNVTKTSYHSGYKDGYAQAVKDHPTVSGNNNTIVMGDKEPFFLLKIWKMRLGV